MNRKGRRDAVRRRPRDARGKRERTSYDRTFTRAFGSKPERRALGKISLSLQDVDS